MVQIGYSSPKWEKICLQQKQARKALPQRSADLVAQRLGELAAFENLGQIPILSPPLHWHPLREDAAGSYVIKLHAGDGIIVRPAGDFVSCADGSPDLATVTEVEVEFVGNYHGKK